MGRALRVRLGAAAVIALVVGVPLVARPPQTSGAPSPLGTAQQLFFSGKYLEAIATAAPLRAVTGDGLMAYELRTSALHFQIKRLLGGEPNKDQAFKRCASCPELLKDFMADVTAGRALAKERLKQSPRDETALYLQAKLDLNEVWLNNSTLGRRKGFGLYKDARRGIEAVLAINPNNVRARVAQAWIDYAVDTRIPFGLKWMFGGGDRKRALKRMRDAAAIKSDVFAEAESSFGLWEMLASEKLFDDARVVASRLIQVFPDNQELQRFLRDKK